MFLYTIFFSPEQHNPSICIQLIQSVHLFEKVPIMVMAKLDDENERYMQNAVQDDKKGASGVKDGFVD